MCQDPADPTSRGWTNGSGTGDRSAQRCTSGVLGSAWLKTARRRDWPDQPSRVCLPKRRVRVSLANPDHLDSDHNRGRTTISVSRTRDALGAARSFRALALNLAGACVRRRVPILSPSLCYHWRDARIITRCSSAWHMVYGVDGCPGLSKCVGGVGG